MTMFNKIAIILTLLAILGTLSGCGIGYNETLFFTKTNVGLDIDSRPPTAEVSIARREAVIAPTFEGGQTPPVLASFSLESEGLQALFAGISSTFVGGDSAVIFAQLYDDPYRESLQNLEAQGDYDSTLYLSVEPVKKTEDKDRRLLQPGEVKPFLFGTDTSFGLKVAWSGITAQVPDTVRLGYNRKEFALAPVTIEPNDNGVDSYKVKIPSFLATIDNSTRLGEVGDVGIKHLQYFATGKAANKIALQYEIRKAMLKRIDPVAGFNEYNVEYVEPDESAEKIRAWWQEVDDSDQQKLRLNKLNSWIKNNAAKVNGNTIDVNTWLYAGRTKEYGKCIRDLQIN